MTNMKRDYWPTDDWRDATPESVDMRLRPLLDLDREIEARYNSVNSFLIVRNGYLVFERYYNGFDREGYHRVASVTKSFTSSLIGIAIDKGFIESVDQKLLSFFPEFNPGACDCLKREMTIKHLLTMTTGFQWRRSAPANEPMLENMRISKNWVEFILSLPVRERRFGRFQYNSAVSHLLSAIITRATKTKAQEFANRHLFEPTGMSEIPTGSQLAYNVDDTSKEGEKRWSQDPQGNNCGGWGLALKPRDMARFGFLYLNQGQWDGKQVIPSEWIADSTKPHTRRYGYHWWLDDVNGLFVYAAVGHGGNHIYCLPEMDLVVAIASGSAGRWRDRWTLMEEYVIPAVG